MSEQNKIMEAYLEMVSEASCGSDRKKAKYEGREECAKCEGEGCQHCDDRGYHEVEEKKLDPVDKKELKGKHSDRDDKDIDNDGDVDDSDEYLHKRRKAIASKGKKPAGNSGEKTPEISKIGERNESVDIASATEELLNAIELMFEGKKETANALPPEEMDGKDGKAAKDFAAKHKVQQHKHDDLEKVEPPKERTVKKEDVSEWEVIRRILSGNIEEN